MKIEYKVCRMAHSRYGYLEKVETMVQTVQNPDKVMEVVEKLRSRSDVREIKIIKD